MLIRSIFLVRGMGGCARRCLLISPVGGISARSGWQRAHSLMVFWTLSDDASPWSDGSAEHRRCHAFVHATTSANESRLTSVRRRKAGDRAPAQPDHVRSGRAEAVECALGASCDNWCGEAVGECCLCDCTVVAASLSIGDVLPYGNPRAVDASGAVSRMSLLHPLEWPSPRTADW